MFSKGFEPSRALGQNFLVDANIARKIASEAAAGQLPRAIEIGPGAGSLTIFLAEFFEQVLAIEADRSLDYGAYLSFSGIATFKNAEDVRQSFLMAPDDRILVETDAPYLAPVPLRGRPNVIGNVAITASFLAQLRGVEERDFATMTWQNTIDAFKLS